MYNGDEIILDLPPVIQKIGMLLANIPYDREEDLLIFTLISGKIVNVDYFNHSYHISLIPNNNWGRPLLKVRTRNVSHAKKVIEDLSRKYS